MARVIQHLLIPQPPDCDSVLEYIPQNLRRQIQLGTCTTDLRPYIQDASDSLVGIRPLWFPSGVYPVDVGTTALRIAASGASWLGPGVASSGPATIKAMGHSLGGTDHSGMLVIDGSTGNTIRGLTFDRGNFWGDHVITKDCVEVLVQDCQFQSNSAVFTKECSASAATDYIAAPGGTNPSIANGDRVEFTVEGIVGSSLPAPLVPNKGYFIRDKGGDGNNNHFKVSTTPGGGAVNLTTNGSGQWEFHKYAYTWETSSVINNTIGVVGHQFQVGHKVTCCCPDGLGVVSNMPSFIDRGRSYYVVEVPDADHFKVSLTQGGTPVTVTTTGSLSYNPQWALEYNPIRGGQMLYGAIENIRGVACTGGLKILLGECGTAGYYGWNVGKISRVVGMIGHTLHGIIHFSDSTVEGHVSHPTEAAIRTSGSHVTLSELYFEVGYGTVTTVGILSEGLTSVHGCSMYGSQKTDVGTIGIAIFGNGQTNGAVTHNRINSFEKDIAFLADMPDSGEADFVSLGNDCDGCLYSQLTVNNPRTGTYQRHFLQHVRDYGYGVGGSMAWELRQSGNNPTALELGLGNVRQIEANAAHTIDTVTTAGTAGTLGASGMLLAILANATGNLTKLDATKFQSLTGVNRLLGAKEAVLAAVDVAGLVRLLEPYGSVVAHTPPLLAVPMATSVAAQSLFDAPPSPGTYAVDWSFVIGTATATTGTWTVTIAWNDGVARSVNVVSATAATATGQFSGRQIMRIASGNPTIAVTGAGLDGTPSVTLRCPTSILERP